MTELKFAVEEKHAVEWRPRLGSLCASGSKSSTSGELQRRLMEVPGARTEFFAMAKDSTCGNYPQTTPELLFYGLNHVVQQLRSKYLVCVYIYLKIQAQHRPFGIIFHSVLLWEELAELQLHSRLIWQST